MQIVLVKDHETLGKALDVLTVKDGFARNFLIPSGIAVPATEGNRRKVAETKRIAETTEQKKIVEARERAQKIEQVPCTMPVKVGEEDKLFGSVTAQEIADFLTKEGFPVDRHSVGLEEPIRQLGVYTVNIKLYKDISANLKVWVVKEDQQ